MTGRGGRSERRGACHASRPSSNLRNLRRWRECAQIIEAGVPLATSLKGKTPVAPTCTGLDPLEETGLGAFLLGRPAKACPAGR